MKRLRPYQWTFLATVALTLLQSATTVAQSPPFSVTGFPPTLPVEIAGNAWFVFVDGVIDRNSPQQFEKYITENHIPPSSVIYLNSPGGNLFAGIELGRLIRKHGFSTDIGIKQPGSSARSTLAAGGCFSACAYTFLGGQFRYLHNGSRFGVHRFSTRDPKDSDADRAQVASAVIVDYLRSMDIDTDLFKYSVGASAKEMNELDRDTLIKLNVINNGVTRPTWSIESVEGNLYLKGQRLTEVSGINKFMIICSEGHPALYVIFDTLRRDAELMSMASHSLLIDGNPIPLQLISRTIQNGYYNGTYRLSVTDINAIKRATTVGIALQFATTAPVFLGFQGMPIQDGRQKLFGFLNSCRRP